MFAQGDISGLEKHLGKYMHLAMLKRNSISFFTRRHIQSAVDDMLCEVSMEQLDASIKYLNSFIAEQIREEHKLQSMQYIRDLLELKRIDFIQVSLRKQQQKHRW